MLCVGQWRIAHPEGAVSKRGILGILWGAYCGVATLAAAGCVATALGGRAGETPEHRDTAETARMSGEVSAISELRVRRLILVDDEGHVAAELGFWSPYANGRDGAGTLRFYDRHGRGSAIIGESGVVLLDEKNRIRAAMTSAPRLGVWLYDEAGEERVGVYQDGDEYKIDTKISTRASK
jgi:hypothetical protein